MKRDDCGAMLTPLIWPQGNTIPVTRISDVLKGGSFIRGTLLGTVMEILNESINFRVRSKLPSKFSNAQKLFISSARRLSQPPTQGQTADPSAQSAEEKCWGH